MSFHPIIVGAPLSAANETARIHDAHIDGQTSEWGRLQSEYVRRLTCWKERVSIAEERQRLYKPIPKAVQQRIDAARRKLAFAEEACFAWLDTHSPRGREWRSCQTLGVHRICSELTAEEALSETPRALPAPERRRHREAGF